VGVTIYPERDDVLIVRRLTEDAAREIQEAWDVQTVLGEPLAVQCAARDYAERQARRVAQTRHVSVFYEHDPRRADSVLEFIVSYRVDNAAPVA
jgi:hypothetical protein